jgi:hypothetical protein
MILYQGGYAPSRRESRLAAREIARDSFDLQVRQSRIANETEATIAKGQSITAFTASAMTDVARIGQLQHQVELLAPDTSARLAFLADSHAFAETELLMDHQRRIRRL